MPPRKKAALVPEAGPPAPFKKPGFVTSLAKRTQRSRSLKQIMTTLRQKRYHPSAATYVNVSAPPSLKPPKRYCDITGLEAKYTDPKTHLRFRSKKEYAIISSLSPAQVGNLLEIRGARLPGI